MHIHSLKLIAHVSTYEVNSCKRFYGFCWLLQFLERVINCISQSSYATYVTINHYNYLFVSDKSESNGIFLRKHFTLTDKYLLFYSVYLIVVRGGGGKLKPGFFSWRGEGEVIFSQDEHYYRPVFTDLFILTQFEN